MPPLKPQSAHADWKPAWNKSKIESSSTALRLRPARSSVSYSAFSRARSNSVYRLNILLFESLALPFVFDRPFPRLAGIWVKSPEPLKCMECIDWSQAVRGTPHMTCLPQPAARLPVWLKNRCIIGSNGNSRNAIGQNSKFNHATLHS